MKINNFLVPQILTKDDYIDKYHKTYLYSRKTVEDKINNLTDYKYNKFKEAMDVINRAEAEQKKFDVFSKKLQCNAGYLDIAQKGFDLDDGTKVSLVIKFNNDLIPRLSRSERIGNTVRSWDKDGKITTINKFKNDKKLNATELYEQFMIVNNQNGEPSKIVHSKKSDILNTVYESTEYKLKDYNESIDVINEIKNNKLQGGKKLSWVERLNENTVEFNERILSNQTLIKRKYRQTLNSSGEIIKSKYSYQIFNKEGNPLLNMNRAFSKDSNNHTTTVINGKKYIAIYDDVNKTIKIKGSSGKSALIKVEDYCKQEDVNKIYNLFKNANVDTLLQIKNSDVRAIEYCDNALRSYISPLANGHGYKLVVGNEPAILSHEVGHLIDYKRYKNLRENKEIIKAYNKEWGKFVKNNTISTEKTINYFSQYSFANSIKIPGMIGGENSGLGEMIAEVNLLMKNCGNVKPMSARTMLLVRNFPNTIALIAKNLGY